MQLRANGFRNPQIAEKLGISYHTVKHHISGGQSGSDKTRSGILGIIEEATGKRPASNNWVAPLVGDVLLFRNSEG